MMSFSDLISTLCFLLLVLAESLDIVRTLSGKSRSQYLSNVSCNLCLLIHAEVAYCRCSRLEKPLHTM